MKWKSKIREVASLGSPELAPYRTLRRPREHMAAGLFVAEGEKVVTRLLESKIQVVSLLVTHKWLGRLESRLSGRFGLQTAASQLPTIFVSDEATVENIVGYDLHQGIMAVGRIPAPRTLHEVVQSVGQPHLFIALDGLVNSENVGVIVRCAAAFGVDGVIVGETSSSPYLRRAVRNSMGAVFSMPVVHVQDLAKSLEAFSREWHTRIIAAHPAGKTDIRAANFRESGCIVFGNEGEGISPEILAKCDQQVTIPMLNGTDSLNVANACAVFLYEARRQRLEGR